MWGNFVIDTVSWSRGLQNKAYQKTMRSVENNPRDTIHPVRPSWVSKQFTGVGLKSSVLDKRRTFPTKYYYGGVESESCENIQCFIVKSCECMKEPLTVESFTLITERDDQGQRQYCLRDDNDVDKTIFRRYDDIITKRSQLHPRGAVILEFDDPKATCACIGILNFTEEGLISPVFFTPETLTG